MIFEQDPNYRRALNILEFSVESVADLVKIWMIAGKLRGVKIPPPERTSQSWVIGLENYLTDS